ncbi:MAG: hypothetical protein GY862_06130 [Gammaproteobacteria bacterium]|nr:hypothetical protein [Gammaproteobacteria bacterium]
MRESDMPPSLAEKHPRPMRKKIIVFLSLLLLATLGLGIQDYRQFTIWKAEIEETAKRQIQNGSAKAVNKIDETLHMVEQAAKRLAKELSAGEASLDNLEARQKAISKDNPGIFGLGAAFVPELIKESFPHVSGRGRPPEEKSLCTGQDLADFLYAPYLRRSESESKTREQVFVNNSYDYTCKSKYWYTCPLGLYPDECPRTSGEMWLEPYFGEASQRMVEEYALPFHRPGGKARGEKPVGVAWANMSLKDFTGLLASLDTGNMGYSFILSPKGIYIAHPKISYTRNSWSIEGESVVHNTPLLKLFRAAKKEKSSVVGLHRDPLSERDAWWIFQHVPRADWVLGVVVIKDELMIKHSRKLRRYKIKLALYTLMFLLVTVLFVIAVLGHRKNISFWHASVGVSMGLMLAIGAIWYLVIKYPDFGEMMDTRMAVDREARPGSAETTHDWPSKIMTPPQLKRFQNRYQYYLKPSGKDRDTVFLPAGIFVRSFHFPTADTVRITGYLWQQLPGQTCQSPQEKKSAENTFRNQEKSERCMTVSAGVIFPDAEETVLEPSYRHPRTNGGFTVGWHFDIILREDFGYKHYPFDVGNIKIRIQHKEFASKAVLLVPDLNAYSILSSHSLPGLEKKFVPSEWKIEGSFFGYGTHYYNTDFGIENDLRADHFPEFYFNILVKRRILSPFISQLMPLIVAAVILFALLLTITRKEIKNLLGFDTSSFLGSCAGLFFGVLIGHASVRSALQVSEVVYLESFYLFMYAALLLAAINAYLFSVHEEVKILQWRDNLLPKLAYWPMLLSLILWITLHNFY